MEILNRLVFVVEFLAGAGGVPQRNSFTCATSFPGFSHCPLPPKNPGSEKRILTSA